ncbi:FecR family protein [Chitinophaga rhizophila]|uniref:FecR domain-containing protein n=1 Tax=Chitinophaga rhizophila TaxID=2866212 RepID=A0ABS7GIB8_9BACT|nr:FecR domain-containing protein [Chitinophaga rhizophila]MBW8686417.1 FecR domain-containing protein [Chitinophaga rhizophila]
MELPKHYDDYTTDDFIKDDAFLHWVHYPDQASDELWQTWLATHPYKRQQVEEARNLIIQLQFKEQLPDESAIEMSLGRNLLLLEAAERTIVPVAKPRSIKRLLWWAAAAAVIAGIIITAGYLLRPAPITTIQAYAADVRTVWLPDSSIVRLNAGAEISYHSDWRSGSQREVWLKGEAFFDIKPSSAGIHAPEEFIVHSGNVLIDVLGTSFNVRENKVFTTVTLNTGKIKLRFKDLPETPMVLTPGDFVKYDVTGNKIIRKKVNPALYAVWKENHQHLEKIKLQEIASYIEDTYNYHVKISSRQLAQQELSGSLRVKDEASLLETLAFALSLKIEKEADTLFIRSSNQ